MSRRLFYLVSHLLVAVQVKYVCDQIKSILVVLDFSVQPGQVEAIGKVIFVYFAEVFVTP